MKQYMPHVVQAYLGHSEIEDLKKTVEEVKLKKEFQKNRVNIWELHPKQIKKIPTLKDTAEDIRNKLQSESGLNNLKLDKVWIALTEPSVADQTKGPYLTHFDKRRFLKGMVYLHDVEVDDGPIHFGEYEDSFRVDDVRRGLPENHQELGLNIVGSDQLTAEPLPVVGKAGDLVLFDTNAPHKAGNVKKGHSREVVRFDFQDPSFDNGNFDGFSIRGFVKNLFVKSSKL